MRFLTAPVACLVLAAPAFAQEVDAARADALVAAIEANGCAVARADSATFFPANGFDSPVETRVVIDHLRATGRAVTVGDLLHVVTEACPAPEGADMAAASERPTADPARIADFVTLMEESDCDMLVGEMPLVFPANGFTSQEETRMIIGQLIAEGSIVLLEGPDRIELMNDSCPAS
jgi:hypothetical protein